jgi:hypothetical protein
MANVRQSYIKKVNKRGDVFFDYGSTPDQLTTELCFPSDDSDNTEPSGIGDGQDEVLSGQFAGLGFRDAGAGTRARRPRGHSEENNGTTRTATNLQWEIDNLPIDSTHPRKQRVSSTFRPSSNLQWETDNMPGAWPSDGEPDGESTPYDGGLSDELAALLALERAYDDLQLPMPDDVGGESKSFMVQLAVQFIFRTLPWLNHIRGDLETLADLYDESDLAEKFYRKYSVAIWGVDNGGGRELHDQRLTRLDTFFAALRTQDTTRDDAEGMGDEPLKQLVHRRRAAAAASRTVPEGTHPVGSLPKLYAALEVQTADNWVNDAFPRAVAEVLLESLSRVRDPAVTSFPCSLPSGVLIEGVIDQIMGRYGNKLWPNDTARPEDATATLHRYILVLMRTNMTSKDIEKGVEMLDSFLGVDDAGAEEESSLVYEDANENGGLECTLAHLAEHKSCSHKFESATELAEHLIEVHEWDEELAVDVAHDHFG